MQSIHLFSIFMSVCGLVWITCAARMIRSWRPIVFTLIFTPVLILMIAVTTALIFGSKIGADSTGYGGLAVLGSIYYFGIVCIPLALGISMVPRALWPLDLGCASTDQIFVRNATQYAGFGLIFAAILPTLILVALNSL